MRPASFFLPLLAALAACDDCNDCDGGGGSIPIFVETEPNDDPLTANDFGVLQFGDHFFIDGFVRDDLVDPFDGFEFTASQPLHVDFQLFIGNAAADLDVCLYDPQIDQTVACFATSDDPERGGVDVFAGGLDFQLVIESFVGDATYSLEIAVMPLFALGLAPQAPAAGAELQAVGARSEHAAEAEHGYRKPRAQPRIVFEQSFEIDEARGLVIEHRRILPGAE